MNERSLDVPVFLLNVVKVTHISVTDVMDDIIMYLVKVLQA